MRETLWTERRSHSVGDVLGLWLVSLTSSLSSKDAATGHGARLLRPFGVASMCSMEGGVLEKRQLVMKEQQL
jgi:hypothetical protein